MFLKFMPHSIPRKFKLAAVKLSGKDANMISRLSGYVSPIDDRDKKLLVGMAQKMARR